jgi:ribosomal-protein-alanine N-acetyltransferase
MESQDLHDVMRIEKASFGSPWSQRFFLEEIRVDVSRAWVACIPREGAEEIIGYVCGRFGAEEASILNIAVSSKVRRRGLGRILLQRVISEARVHHCRQVSLEVRRSNLAAQNLYGSEGFITKGIRRHYYSDNGEDALIMVMPLIS